jgi:hypothetical protein
MGWPEVNVGQGETQRIRLPIAAAHPEGEFSWERGPARPVNPSDFCPACGWRLQSRACKLICACGYYMSCSDFY